MYMILDEIDGPQRFPFAEFLVSVQKHIAGVQTQTWQVKRVWGHGEQIMNLENAIGEKPYFVIEPEALLKIARAPDEWFYDIVCYRPEDDLAFGIFDSTCMFVDGRSPAVQQVIADFKDVKYNPSPAPDVPC